MATETDKLILRLDAATARFEAKLNQAGRQVDSFSNNSGKAVKRLRGGFVALGAAIGAVGLASYKFSRQLVDTAKKSQALDVRMSAAVKNSKVAAASFEFVRAESERLGLSFESAAQGFAGFAASGLRAGLTFGEVKDIFTGVSEAATSMQLSAADTRLVFSAVEQIASKGVASMEELRQQLGERLPGALQIAGASMGMTGQAFIDAISNGEILAKDLLPALGKGFTEEFGKSAVKASDSLQASMNRLDTAFYDLKVEVGEGGFIDSFKTSVEELTELLKDEEIIEGLKAMASVLGDVAIFAVKATAAFGTFSKALIERIKRPAMVEGIIGPDDETSEDAINEKANKLKDSLTENVVKIKEGVDEELEKQGVTGPLLDHYTLGSGDGEPTEEQKEREKRIQERLKEALGKGIEAQQDAEATVEAFKRASAKERVAIAVQEGRDLLGELGTRNKGLFQLNKALATADAIVNVHQGVTKALARNDFATAALVAAKGAAEIAAIQSTSFGGGGGTGGAGGAIPVRQVDDLGRPVDTGGQSREVNLNVSGGNLSRDQIRTLTEQIIEFAQDGGTNLTLRSNL